MIFSSNLGAKPIQGEKETRNLQNDPEITSETSNQSKEQEHTQNFERNPDNIITDQVEMDDPNQTPSAPSTTIPDKPTTT